MSFDNPFRYLAWGSFFESLLPDFILAFAFFTAPIYGVMGKRFGHQRSAVAASASLGLALSVGLVWWEQSLGLSIRNLGPWAVGFAVIVLASVMYQAIRRTGGSWVGAGIALGASLLVGWAMGLHWLVAEQIMQTVITVALVVGVMAFLLHRQGKGVGTAWANAPALEREQLSEARHGTGIEGCRFRSAHPDAPTSQFPHAASLSVPQIAPAFPLRQGRLQIPKNSQKPRFRPQKRGILRSLLSDTAGRVAGVLACPSPAV